MPGLQPQDGGVRHNKLKEYLNTWPVHRLQSMTLEEYSDVGSKSTLSYWLEFETEPLGRIGGRPANKFGIWRRKSQKPIVSGDFTFDDEYAWYSKHGDTAQLAFETVRSLVVTIAQNADSGDFRAIDRIDYDSLVKWKIAFLYSNYQLLPVYKNLGVRTIARYFEHPNFEKGRISDLSTFIVRQKPQDEDLFDFAYRLYISLTKTQQHRYYLIGTKYDDDKGEPTVNILPQMHRRNVIATDFFLSTDFSSLYNYSRQTINNWCDKNLDSKQEGFASAKRTLSIFLGLKPGDIVALKSHGSYNSLRIVAYGQVTEVNGRVYEHDPDGLGHIIHVDFLETGLSIDTGLNYAHAIHEIVPDARPGHFEKIFGSYSQLETFDDIEDDTNKVLEGIQSRINEKSAEPYQRTVNYTATVAKVHDNLQIAFAKYLQAQFPEHAVRTEQHYIDIKRESANDLYLYEIKPYNSAYQCIRAGIGQLLDYCHSDKDSAKKKHLIIVGPVATTVHDQKFIEFIRSTMNISFDYIAFQNS